MKPGSLAADLQKVGLSEEETDVYLRLLRTGKTKVGKLATYFDMSRSKLYRLLSEMANKGYVAKSMDRPTRYAAEDPEVVIRDRLASLEEECEQLEQLLETAVEPLRQLEAEGHQEIDHHWTRIEGAERILEALQSAARNVEERIWWTSTNEVIVRPDLPPVDELWRTTSERATDGIDVRLLLDLPRKQSELDEVTPELADEGLAIREGELDRRPVDFAILDDEAFLWTRPMDAIAVREAEAMTLRTNAPGVRVPLALLFEELWSSEESKGE